MSSTLGCSLETEERTERGKESAHDEQHDCVTMMPFGREVDLREGRGRRHSEPIPTRRGKGKRERVCVVVEGTSKVGVTCETLVNVPETSMDRFFPRRPRAQGDDSEPTSLKASTLLYSVIVQS